MLGVSERGYHKYRTRPKSARWLRHQWLTDLVSEAHARSRGTYGVRRMHAELTLGKGAGVGREQVALVMKRAGLRGLPGAPKRRKPNKEYLFTSSDLVDRDFTATAPNQLWCTDITEHPTREGKVYCCAVIDACSRKVVGWAIDSRATSTLVINALDMAISARKPQGTVVHSDHGTQFTSWAFSQRILVAGLAPSMGTIGDGYDNAMIESFWGKMQTELLDRQKWKTRVELANAIFDYIEIFHNRQRRHSALGMLTPTEFEKIARPLQPAS